MFRPLLLATSLLVLGSCSKEDVEPTPDIDAPFEQNFALAYHQTAALSQQPAAELSITLQELYYSNQWGCFSSPHIGAKLRVEDAKQGEQQIQLSASANSLSTSAERINTATVQANGRRYSIWLKDMQPGLTDEKTAPEKRTIILHVSRVEDQ